MVPSRQRNASGSVKLRAPYVQKMLNGQIHVALKFGANYAHERPKPPYLPTPA